MLGTVTQSLIYDLNNEVEDNNEAIPPITAGLTSNAQTLAKFAPSIDGVQIEIASIVDQINDLKFQQLDIALEANSIGCGIGSVGIGTSAVIGCIIGVATILATNVYWTEYAYNLPDPWAESSGTIQSNIGNGFTLSFVAEDSNVSIGTYCDFTGIGSCLVYANQIAALELEIDNLKTLIPPLVSGIIPVMSERSDYKMIQFAFEQSLSTLAADTSTINAAVTQLEDPFLQQYFLG